MWGSVVPLAITHYKSKCRLHVAQDTPCLVDHRHLIVSIFFTSEGPRTMDFRCESFNPPPSKAGPCWIKGGYWKSHLASVNDSHWIKSPWFEGLENGFRILQVLSWISSILSYPPNSPIQRLIMSHFFFSSHGSLHHVSAISLFWIIRPHVNPWLSTHISPWFKGLQDGFEILLLPSILSYPPNSPI